MKREHERKIIRIMKSDPPISQPPLVELARQFAYTAKDEYRIVVPVEDARGVVARHFKSLTFRLIRGCRSTLAGAS